MKMAFLSVAFCTVASVASAGCFDAGGYSSCTTDSRGNSHGVNGAGNQVKVTGLGARNDAKWSQHSKHMGHTAIISGPMTKGSNNIGSGMKGSAGTGSNGNSSMGCRLFGGLLGSLFGCN